MGLGDVVATFELCCHDCQKFLLRSFWRHDRPAIQINYPVLANKPVQESA